jgi:hypothetical protein
MGVVREAIEPRQEWSALPPITPDGLPGLQKNLFGEIFGLWKASRAEIQIAVHPLDELVVQLAERVGVSLDDDAVDERHDRRVVGALDGWRRLSSRY